VNGRRRASHATVDLDWATGLNVGQVRAELDWLTERHFARGLTPTEESCRYLLVLRERQLLQTRSGMVANDGSGVGP
jgi:hypothetical protein